MKIAVLGAAGKVGQPVCLMLKNSPLVDEVALYDVCGTDGIAMELGHVDTTCKAISYKNRLSDALTNAQIVAILAQSCRRNSGNIKAQFEENAVIIFDLMCAVARQAPQALVAIATNPVNSMVPLACAVLKKFRVFNPNHVFGVTTVDGVRASTFVAHLKGLQPEKVYVPIIGGFSEKTVVPVLSQTTPKVSFTDDELMIITENVQKGHRDTDSKHLHLAPAFAISRFILSLVKAMKGEENIVECAYVSSNFYSSLRYLITPLQLGINGVQRNLGLPKMSDYEACLMHAAFQILKDDIEIGEEFVTGRKDCPPKKSKDGICKIQCN